MTRCILLLWILACLTIGTRNLLATGPDDVPGCDLADQLFAQQKWAESRSQYDQVFIDRHASLNDELMRHWAERTVVCSLKLSEWDDALQRALKFKNSKNLSYQTFRYWPRGGSAVELLTATISHCDISYRLLALIRTESLANGPEPFQDQLSREIVAFNFELLRILDPNNVTNQEFEESDPTYTDMAWWWDDTRPELEELENSFGGAYRDWSDAIPEDRDGRPMTLTAPLEYPVGLQRARKILYLLDEIERLDTSEWQQMFAKALCYRADLMRRLYGPNSDPQWQSAGNYYANAERLPFNLEADDLSSKQLWQLGDDEARSLVGQSIRVHSLSESESPLALWRRIEQTLPHSGLAPEAIFQRGCYYQNRRQFSQALDEYKRLIENYPLHLRVICAIKQIEIINRAEVVLGSTGVFPSGSSPSLPFACRNTSEVEFTARSVDLKGLIIEMEMSGYWSDLTDCFSEIFNDENETLNLDRHVGAEMVRWTETVPMVDRVATHLAQTPLTQAGAYVVEARIPGAKQVSRGLIIVTGAALIQKRIPGKVLIWVVDSRSGQPLPNQQIQLVRKDKRHEWSTATTDKDGAIYYERPDSQETFALLTTEQGDIAFCEIARAGYDYFGDTGHTQFGVTDRPLYRPGSTVHFRVWVREFADRQYRLAETGAKVRIRIDSPIARHAIYATELSADAAGGVTGSFELDHETPLGEYRVLVEDSSGGYRGTACTFRVEEYKKPEFMVEVLPAQDLLRNGERVTAVIKATYYSGQPVSGAAVRFHVERSRYMVQSEMSTKWDWLYGDGYGDYQQTRELVDQGIARLNDEGVAEIRIDTSRFSQHMHHRLTITAVVRDESRRNIEGRGHVIVSPQQFFAFSGLDRGWYQPGDRAQLEINTRSANELPVSVAGQVSLYRIVTLPTADVAADLQQEIVGQWPVKTNEAGYANLEFRLPTAGQYRVVFEAQDGWQQPVTAESLVWVNSPLSEAAKSQFGDLEMIPDKRTYEVGESARVLINTAHANARLLIVDSMNGLRFVDIPNYSLILEIPITSKHVPNFFLEGTFVHNGRVLSESCEIYVPPVEDLLTVEILPSQQTFQPGQKGEVKIKVTDRTGNPISGSMALRAYDKSLTYIQQDSAFGTLAFLVNRRAEYWSDGIEHTLWPDRFNASGGFTCPEYHTTNAGLQFGGGMGGSAGMGGGGFAQSSGAATGTRRLSQSSVRRSGSNALSSQESISDLKSNEPHIREDLSDTAVWLPNLQLDEQGQTVEEITFPESLTTWRIQGCIVTPETKVGDSVYEAKTSKDLIVRLQSPRFLVERDQVVLSALVHSYLLDEKEVSVELLVPAKILGALENDELRALSPDDQGNLRLTQHIKVRPGQSHRCDWPLQTLASGLATVTVKAQTDVASDAVKMAFPVNPRALVEAESASGFFLPAEVGNKEISFEIPPNSVPGKSRVEIIMAPSAAGAALTALPFLADYPYGCVEQTMSRFYPTVLASDALTKLGTDLESIARNMSARNQRRASPFSSSPLLSSMEIRRMTDSGLNRLYRFQHADGGWGWWENDVSSPYMTAYVLLGLNTAADSGIHVSESVLRNGVNYLLRSLKDPAPVVQHSANYFCEQALIAYVLSLPRSTTDAEVRAEIDTFIGALVLDIGKLNLYGQALLALALHHQQNDQAGKVLGGILQTLESDEARHTSWVPTPEQGRMHWANDDIETNAWVLRAMIAMEPAHPATPRIVNWLVENRDHGYYWRSTRDSALAVQALVEYLLFTKQSPDDYKVAVHLDGKHQQDIQVSWQNMLEMETRLVLTGDLLEPGKHQITLVKEDHGPLFFSMSTEYYLEYEKILAAESKGLRLERHYYRLSETSAMAAHRTPSVAPVEPARTPLKFGDRLTIGDTIEVELTIMSDNDYEYLAFDDPKPAGCEPIRLRSGYQWGDGLCSNVEIRDSATVFFVRVLPGGKQVLRYQMRVEIPGKFAAMPARGFAMYAPEIRARSDEMQLQIND